MARTQNQRGAQLAHLAAAVVASAAAQRRPEHLGADGLGYGLCRACGQMWPCPASRRTEPAEATTAEPQYPLPWPYSDGTPQDHADALRDHADPRLGGPPLDYAALAAADLIEQAAAGPPRRGLPDGAAHLPASAASRACTRAPTGSTRWA
jgi:hypothetical protein